MHSLPEANFLNPAVQINCGVFIGLPVVSSTHGNLASSAFTPGEYAVVYTDGSIGENPDFSPSAFYGKGYLLTEFHTTLLAIGIQRNDRYYSFSVIEKNNGIAVFSSDLLQFAAHGSERFEDQHINASGTTARFNHLREYALGISRKYNANLLVGAKVKLLFGKFNFATTINTLDVYVEPVSYNLQFDAQGGFNGSMPYSLVERAPDVYGFSEVYEGTWLQHLMHAGNPGIAIDLGFIYRYSESVTLSGSLLDLGMIYYRSKLGNYHVEGDYTYTGPLGNNPLNNNYLQGAFNELNRNMNEELTTEPYLYFLDPRLYLGAAYKINNRYDLNFLLYNRLLPRKLQTGFTVSVLTRPLKSWEATVSWSYMNRSFLNLGLGLIYGKNPLQLYVVSDNLPGLIWPLGTKNINLRAGINLNLGCGEKFDVNQRGCAWLKKAEERKERMERFRRGKKSKDN